MEQQTQQPMQQKTETKPPVKINWKFIAIVAGFAIFASGGVLLLRGMQTPPVPSGPAPQPQSISTSTPKELALCAIDDECVVVPSQDCCSSKRAINKKYEQDYLDNPVWQIPSKERLEFCEKVECDDETRGLNYAKCVNNQCQLASESPNIDTSNWQTYRNEEFGFEVRYPKAWYFSTTRDSVNHRNASLAFIISSKKLKDPFYYHVGSESYFAIIPNLDSLDGVSPKTIKKNRYVADTFSGERINYFAQDGIMVSSRISLTAMPDHPLWSSGVIWIVPKMLDSQWSHNPNDDFDSDLLTAVIDENNRKVLDQILSMFRFIK